MVLHLLQIVAEYQERMRAIMPFIHEGSYDRQFMREDAGPNKEFLTFFFCNNDLAIQFLKDVSLLRSKVQCNTCGRDMTWCASADNNRYRWRCRKKVGGTIAHYMFEARCKAQGVPPFLQFLDLVANTDWLVSNDSASSAPAT
jgi:hypothetical protein